MRIATRINDSYKFLSKLELFSTPPPPPTRFKIWARFTLEEKSRNYYASYCTVRARGTECSFNDNKINRYSFIPISGGKTFTDPIRRQTSIRRGIFVFLTLAVHQQFITSSIRFIYACRLILKRTLNLPQLHDSEADMSSTNLHGQTMSQNFKIP